MRAAAIRDYLAENDYPPVSEAALAKYGQRHWSTGAVLKGSNLSSAELTSMISDLSELGNVEKVTLVSKDDGFGNISIQHQITMVGSEDVESLEPAPIPKISVRIPSKGSRKRSKPSGMRLAVVLPDMQIGALEGLDTSLRPTQDEPAIDVAFQIMAIAEQLHGIDLVVNLGDNLDFPVFSTHRSAPGYNTRRAVKYAIDRYSAILATQRAIATDARIIDLPSNHVARLTNIIVDRIPGLLGISRAGEDSPLLSVANLCRYDEYGVEMVPGGYPDGKFWASPNLRFEHGSKVSSIPGATARKYLQEGVSVIYGHVHRSEWIYHTAHTATGSVTSFAGSPGALCSFDGVLPSSLTGITEDGILAGVQKERWHHGVALVWYDPEGVVSPRLEHIYIEDGVAFFRGQELTATVDKWGEKL